MKVTMFVNILALWLAAFMVPAHAQNPVAGGLDDGSIRLEGKVASTGPRSFVLDYGDDVVEVEVDHRAGGFEDQWLETGDQVTVYGRIDHDRFEEKRIEASSVFVASGNTFYQFKEGDEELVGALSLRSSPRTNWLTLTGRVREIKGQSFLLGDKPFAIDTAHMADNPLDDIGRPQVDVGDRVTVSGELESTLFTDRELVASEVIVLENPPQP